VPPAAPRAGSLDEGQTVSGEAASLHEALRSSEELLRRVLASSGDCIKILDLDGNLLSMTEGGQKLLEIPDLTPYLNTCWPDWWKGDDRFAAAQAVAAARAGGSGRFEAFSPTAGGTPRWWDVVVTPIFGADGKPERLLSVSRDITERVRSAAKIEAERSRLADVFRQSPAFMAVLRGPRHVFELANDQYLALVGRRDVIGKSVGDALPEVRGQGFIELLDGVYATGEPFVGRNLRVALQRQPGGPPEERHVEFVYQPLKEPDGSVSGIFVHGVDLTDRHKAEAAVRESEERFRAAFDQAVVGMALADMKGVVLRVNGAFCRIVGRPPEELIGRDSRHYSHPDDQGHNFDNLRRLEQAQADSAVYEKRYVRPRGGIVWTQVSISPTHGTDGRPSGLIAIIQDITEAKAAADALRESESRFRQLADAMPQIVFTARPDGHVDYFNRQWYEYTGLPEGTVGYENWKQVHTEGGLKRVAAVWNESLRTGQPYEIEYRLRRADGTYRWHLGRAVAVRDPAGNIVRWFGTNTDIHDAKELQEQNERLLDSERAARAEAERTSRMKDEFLATLSHELRTPLNAILGWSQILKSAPGDPEELEEGLAVIERNARAQTQIIEDLLDMSRIISGKVRLDVRPLELAGIVKAAIETVAPAAAAKEVRIQTDVDAFDHPLSGDPNRLQQVFWNQLSNAVTFTPRGGHVQVRVERVDSHLQASVTDTGEGIKPEFLPYVFDRFRQGDASTTRRHGGLGLGLAIVKQLVELHGGGVAVRSAGTGRGSTFTVTLPLTAVRPEPEDDAVPGRPQGGTPLSFGAHACLRLKGIKVLVVDDEADARGLIRRVLEECDAEVTTVATVDEAIAAIGSAPPHVLVSDIGMPGEDGYSLIRRVRALGPGKGGDVPAVALTAYARAEDRVKAVLTGFQMHVAKPVEPAELIAMVASLAGRAG
jgi:PAS domain S-box-containing protein